MKNPVCSLAVILAASTFLSPPAAAQSSPAPFTTGYRYDAARQLTGTIMPDPDESGALRFAATRNSYDLSGRLRKIEVGELANWQPETVAPSAWPIADFAIQKITDVDYDGLDHKTREIVRERTSSGDVVRTVTQYKYDPVGRLVCTAVRMDPAVWLSQTDACIPQLNGPNGPDRITRNVYDAKGQLIQLREGVGLANLEAAEATYRYTANGQRDLVIDAGGNRAQMIYDGHDRQVQWILPSKTGPGAFNDSTQALAISTAGLLSTQDADATNDDYEAYTYDNNGNRLTLRKRDGRTLKFSYDALNRMTSKCVTTTSCTAPGAATGRDVYYAYDLMGRQTEARFDSAGGADRLTNRFNGFGELEWSEIVMGGGPVRRLTHQYDLNGNRNRLTHPDGVYFSISYDGLDRVSNASWTTGTGTTPFMAITYDAGGRRSNINRGSSHTGYGHDNVSRLTSMNQRFLNGAGNANLTFGYNPASQLIRETRDNDQYAWTGTADVNRPYSTNGLNQYTAAGTSSFAYDANGNLTGEPGVTYVYDAENRLVSDSTGTELRYDPAGRLWQVSKAGGVTQFLYDGDSLVAEYDQLGTMKWRYFFGPNADEPIVADMSGRLDCDNTRFLHLNHQGSMIAAADCHGNRTTVATYDEYGIPGPNNWGRFQYTGQAWIPEIGMYYYKARIYSPKLGRFLQTDPIGYDDQVNLYAYSANDPVNLKDSTGQRATVGVTGIEISPERYGVPSVRIPFVQGARGFRPSAWTHEYMVSGRTPLTDGGAIGAAYRTNPTPGNDRPATRWGTLNNVGRLTPTDGGDNYVMSFAVPSPDPSRYTDIIVNYTVAGRHSMAEGFVMGYGEKNTDGTYTLRHYGEGNAPLQVEGLKWLWGPAVENVWGGVQYDIMRNAMPSRCSWCGFRPWP